MVVEYEDLPTILTIEEAIEAESYYMADRTIQRGDLDAGYGRTAIRIQLEEH